MIHLLRTPLPRMAELGDARPIDLNSIEVPQVAEIGAVYPGPDSGVLTEGEGRIDRRSVALPHGRWECPHGYKPRPEAT